MTTYSETVTDGVGVTTALTSHSTYHLTLSSGIGVAAVQTVTTNAIIAAVVKFSHAQSEKATYHLSLQDYIYLHSILTRMISASLPGGNLGLHHAVAFKTGTTILDRFRLASVAAGSAHYRAVLSDTLKLNSALARFLKASLSQGLGVRSTLGGYLTSHKTLTDRVGIASVLGHSLIVSATMSSSMRLTHTQVLKALYHQTLSDSVQFHGLYISPDSNITTWAINMRTGAATEYTNYNFNSFAKMGNKYLGASSSGLYELDGDNDAGTSIIADIMGGFAQFGGSHFASLKAVYLGLRGGGDFIFRVVEADGTTRDYAVTTTSMRTARVQLGKGLRSRYFAYELISTGQDFDLDSIEFVPIVMQRRIL